MKKTNLLFLHPGPVYRPDLPDFKDKYLMLSEKFEGVIITWTSSKRLRNYKIANFIFQGLQRERLNYLAKFTLGIFMIARACRFHFKKRRFNIIICYDPVFTAMMGVILKYILGCKLVVEINSNMFRACFLGKVSVIKKLKRVLYKLLIYFSLLNADSIRLLYKDQLDLPESLLKKKKVFYFHDFVATHYFTKETTREEKYILFIGYPFYLKGIDVLIKAFNIISKKYPDFTLRLIGHRLKDEAKMYGGSYNGKIQFCLPVFYDRIREQFLKCYCFVLPSRSEGVARVLLEAMSSGKPVIGSRVGGTPSVIEGAKNGFLFKSEDVNELVLKLDILLGNPDLARQMGNYGKRLIDEKFSSFKYCEHFSDMIETTIG